MRWPRLALAVLAMLPALTAHCLAADDQIVFNQVKSTWTVAENDTWTVDAEITIRAPLINPAHVVRVPLTWSAATEKLTVTQVRIDKPDGQSTILDQTVIRDDPLTGDAYFHEFSDQRRLLVTIPDVDPGDLIVIHTHRDVFRPTVPGGFTATIVLDPNVTWEETNFTVSVPAGMPFHFETRGFDQQSELIKDRMMHYFHSPKVPKAAHTLAVLGPFDRLPLFVVSTFRDWDEFATAYASVLLPHAKVTPAISAMAAKLTQGQPDKPPRARLLYEWVRDNIRDVPLPLEQTAPDPNDAEQVMTKGYGDDKDHVVLLYALLAARGIAAEMVLLNATDDATIADVPGIRPMNHLILFLPGIDVYADPTLPVAPFGVLPFGEIGKPAIHLGGSGLTRRTIPLPPSGATMARTRTDMVLGADGALSGTTTTMGRGAFGIWLRDAARSVGDDGPRAAATLLRRHGTPGTGTFSFAPPTAPGDDYTIQGNFELENQAALLRGGFFAMWTGLRVLPRPGDVLGGPIFLRDLPPTQPTFCYPGIDSEELSLTLPEGRTLAGMPPDAKIDTDMVHYRSHWSVDGQRVTVSREFQSIGPGPVCDHQAREDMAGVLTKVRADLLSSVGIEQVESPEPPAAAGAVNREE